MEDTTWKAWIFPVVVRWLLGPLSLFGLWLALLGVIASPNIPNRGNNPPPAAHLYTTHPTHPPPYIFYSWYYSGFEKIAQSPAVSQLPSRNSYKTLAKRLLQLYSISSMAAIQHKELQWFQYLKLVFLNIPNVTIPLVS